MITYFIIVGFYAYFFYAKNFYKNRLNELKKTAINFSKGKEVSGYFNIYCFYRRDSTISYRFIDVN